MLSIPCGVSIVTRVFRLNPVVCLHWVGWDDEFVVFEETSGQTHQLDTLRAFVLNAATDGSVQSESLLADLASVMPDELNDLSSELLNSILEEFESVGLLESALV